MSLSISARGFVTSLWCDLLLFRWSRAWGALLVASEECFINAVDDKAFAIGKKKVTGDVL